MLYRGFPQRVSRVIAEMSDVFLWYYLWYVFFDVGLGSTTFALSWLSISSLFVGDIFILLIIS